MCIPLLIEPGYEFMCSPELLPVVQGGTVLNYSVYQCSTVLSVLYHVCTGFVASALGNSWCVLGHIGRGVLLGHSPGHSYAPCMYSVHASMYCDCTSMYVVHTVQQHSMYQCSTVLHHVCTRCVANALGTYWEDQGSLTTGVCPGHSQGHSYAQCMY